MNKVTIVKKSIYIVFLIAETLFWASCKIDRPKTPEKNTSPNLEKSIVEKEFLVGSWKDTSPSALHFTLFNDGTAHSDNMNTLLYKNWNVKGNQITFTVESIGNGTSSIDTVTYIIEKLYVNELILRRGTNLSEYTKE